MPNTDFQHHWLEIGPDRLERYERMFQWNEATAPFYDGARIGPGQVIADFGCGPGHAAIEFAKRVGPNGHVYALDINPEFVRRAREKAKISGLADRITAQLLDTGQLPLPDQALDRVVARNTIIYVADPVATLREFRRILKPGGLAHAIEGDWYLTAATPVSTERWTAFIRAASWAWPHPQIGRCLYSFARQAGFAACSIQVITTPDLEGRLVGAIETVADYARQGGLPAQEIDVILETVNRALAEKTYLAIIPQFIVTATA